MSQTRGIYMGEPLQGADNFMAADSVWEAISGRLKGELGEQTYRSWIANLEASEIDPRTVRIGAPNRFCCEYVEQNFGFRIRQYWADLDSKKRMVRFEVTDGLAHPPSLRAAAARPAASAASNEPRPPARIERTFDNFAIGPANEVAAAVARQIASDDTARFNPVYIHGGYGMGKTHLLRAIQHECRARDSERRIAYLTGERFTSDFMAALKTRETAAFKETMRKFDLLLLDDLHIMAGKTVTQEEFHHTLTDLIQDGRQVVITGDRKPGELEGIDERVRSLLVGGLRCDIEAPDLDLRRRILDRAVTDLQRTYPDFTLPGQACDFVAARVTGSPRELIGALNTVVSRTLLIGREATTESVTAALSDYAVATSRRITVDRIQKQVAAFYNLNVPELLSPRRARAIARPRQIAMYLAKQMTQRSLPDIGRRFGGKDHTTVLHAVRRITALMEDDPAVHDDVNALIRLLER